MRITTLEFGRTVLVLGCMVACTGQTATGVGPMNVDPSDSGGSADTAGASSSSGSSSSSGGSSSSMAGSSSSGGDGSVATPGVHVTPKNGRVDLGGNLQFSAVVIGLGDTSVTWKVAEGDKGGSIDSNGRYSAPSTAGTFHVVATSTSDSSKSDTATVSATEPAGTPPTLTPGVWTNVSPPTGLGSDSFGGAPSGGVLSLAIDPSNPRTIYIGIEHSGIWKTTDAGTSWEQLAPNADVDLYDGKTNQLECPMGIAVDPNDPNHLYAVAGVRDANNGFWNSTDGGKSWAIPKGFKDVTPTYDITTIAVDPSDFGHVIVGSHAYTNVGVLEGKNGATTWTVHPPPDSTWPAGTYGLSMLYNPALGIGDSRTWLVHHVGFWLTKDAGLTWKQTNSEIDGVHGSTETYYSKTGILYSGTGNGLARSKDNGETWERVSQGLPATPYNTLVGDSNNIYTQPGLTDTSQTLVTSETDGMTWKEYRDGSQKVGTGSKHMVFDSANRIVYSANGGAGLLALKVIDP